MAEPPDVASEMGVPTYQTRMWNTSDAARLCALTGYHYDLYFV